MSKQSSIHEQAIMFLKHNAKKYTSIAFALSDFAKKNKVDVDELYENLMSNKEEEILGLLPLFSNKITEKNSVSAKTEDKLATNKQMTEKSKQSNTSTFTGMVIERVDVKLNSCSASLCNGLAKIVINSDYVNEQELVNLHEDIGKIIELRKNIYN